MGGDKSVSQKSVIQFDKNTKIIIFNENITKNNGASTDKNTVN